MKVPCRVTQLTAGQIRLHIPALTTQPEIIQPLMQFTLHLPEVTSIEIEPAGADLIVKHAATPGARDLILSALAGQPAALAAPKDEPPGTAAPAHSPAPPFADCTLIHATPGRVRLRVPVLRNTDDLGGVLSRYLAQQPGVSHVRLSPFSQSAIIHHDPTLADAQSLVRLAANYQPDPQEIEQWRAASFAQRQDEALQPGRRKFDLALALAALALSFFGGWLTQLLTIALLIASSWWIFRRASWSFQQREFVTVESASAAAIIVLCLAGMLWQAALLVTALLVIALIRARSAVAGEPVTYTVQTVQNRPAAALRNNNG